MGGEGVRASDAAAWDADGVLAAYVAEPAGAPPEDPCPRDWVLDDAELTVEAVERTVEVELELEA